MAAIALTVSGCGGGDAGGPVADAEPATTTTPSTTTTTSTVPSRCGSNDEIVVTTGGVANSALITIGVGADIEQHNDVSPEQTFELCSGGVLDFVSVSIQNLDDSGIVSCTIERNGALVAAEHSTGGYVIAMCSD